MHIKVYGQEGCGKCESFKEKLELMELEYEYDLLIKYTSGDMGSNEQILDLMEYCQFVQTDHIPLPVVEVNGEYYGYSDGMKKIKEIKKGQNV